MNNLKLIYTLLAVAVATLLRAQNPIPTETFLFIEKGDTTHITTAVSADNDELARLRLEPVNLPAVTLPRSIFRKVVDISNRKSIITETMGEENNLLRERDTLHLREIATLRAISSVQQKNIESCEQTNLLLNRSIQSLNGQLEATRELAKSTNRQTGSKLWGLLVGGGIGFGLGAVLGIIVAK